MLKLMVAQLHTLDWLKGAQGKGLQALRAFVKGAVDKS